MLFIYNIFIRDGCSFLLMVLTVSCRTYSIHSLALVAIVYYCKYEGEYDVAKFLATSKATLLI